MYWHNSGTDDSASQGWLEHLLLVSGTSGEMNKCMHAREYLY